MENTATIIQDIIDEARELATADDFYKLLSFIDYTTLEGTDTQQKVTDMCAKAKWLFDTCGHTVAAICIYPTFIKQVKSELSGYPIKVASVAAAFPSGQTDISIKNAEVKFCVDSGADEIDIVISRGKFLEGNISEVSEELKSLRQHAAHCTLKTIIESGELASAKQIAEASQLAISCGADFIKTSTGKAKVGATLLAHYTMVHEIKQHYLSTKKIIGMKPSGGIANTDDAIKYLAIAEHFMGEDYLKNTTFRIGASSLLTNVISQLTEFNPKLNQ